MLFEKLELLVDLQPRGAALNMALDEVLLGAARLPVLRVYRWARPAVSLGYFEPWAPVMAAHPGREGVRRWTGGGVVLHGEDWTYSLMVPRIVPFARRPAAESYQLIHDRLAAAIQVAGAGGATLTEEAEAKVSRACFENPVRFDLLVAGRKIAGAAQRRSRLGLLHQGSVQGVGLPPGFEACFADGLAGEWGPRTLAAGELEAASLLAETKYAAEGWNRKF